MSGVTELGYLGLSVSNLAAWRDYAAGLLGFEAFDKDGGAGKLRQAGVAVERGSPAEAADRHVLALIKLRSPGGIPTEIFYGPQVDKHKAVPPWPANVRPIRHRRAGAGPRCRQRPVAGPPGIGRISPAGSRRRIKKGLALKN